MLKPFGLIGALFLACLPLPLVAADSLAVESPDGRVRATVAVDAAGPRFAVTYRDRGVVAGTLGLDLAGSGLLGPGLRVVATRRRDHDETYAVPVGKTSRARDHHRELVVTCEEPGPPARRLDIAVRAFDDGVAFRYEVPESPGAADFALLDERTRFTFPGDPVAHALPLKDTTTSYEAYYKTIPVSRIGGSGLTALPLLLEPAGPGGAWVALTEANLVDYAGMYLAPDRDRPGTLAARLAPLPGRTDSAKVVGRGALVSPWRVVMVADDPGRLIESDIVGHLNPPSRIADPSWIKPGKTTFPWWNGYLLPGVDFKPGVNTATMKHYIDFCARHGIPYHSLDGLDIAWYGGPIQPSGPTDITRAAPSIDMPELLRYAKEKGVRLRLWLHWKALKPQIDDAFATYERWGIEGVMVDFMDRDDQEMVAFYHEMASKAAAHHLTLNLHGASKPTGLERTWPNVLNYEAALNQEYDKWEKPGEPGTPPAHNLDIAFVRMLAGPLDYHQGGMRSVLPEDYQPHDKAPSVQGTRGHQLAMYVVYQNHLPMLADYPAAYEGQGGLDFLVDVPATWDETRVLHAEFGRALIVARRRGEIWYLGGMTAADPLEVALPLPFLAPGPHVADLTLDDAVHGPNAVVRSEVAVDAAGKLAVKIPRAGGFVARIAPAR